MERKRNFDIHFVGLKNTVHEFSYDVTDSFFRMYEKSPIEKADLKVLVSFDKKDSFFILNFQADGTIHLPCDRCNEPFDYELLCDFEIIFKFEEPEEGIEDEADVVYISRSDTCLNVADIIYDYILVNIPIQVFHPNNQEGKSTCNPEILAKLNITNIKENDEVDPRWASLTKLKS